MLAGEFLREASVALKDRGLLLAVTDASRDRWLHNRVLETFGAATIHRRDKQGAAYVARKTPNLKVRERDFRRRFTARVFGRELDIETRPGVFSHGELDEGALALSEVVCVRKDSRVLDLGCGSGALGIGAALSAPEGCAILVDSSARAVRTTRQNILRNHAGGNAMVLLACDLGSLSVESLDLVLANHPYYSDHRITELFTQESFRVLTPGGEFLLVTKAPQRPAEIIQAIFGRCEAVSRRGYTVIRAIKGSGTTRTERQGTGPY